MAQAQLPDGALYPDETDGDPFTDEPNFYVERLLERWPRRANDVRTVTGHVPLAVRVGRPRGNVRIGRAVSWYPVWCRW
jgi:hypothetical protein